MPDFFRCEEADSVKEPGTLSCKVAFICTLCFTGLLGKKEPYRKWEQTIAKNQTCMAEMIFFGILPGT